MYRNGKLAIITLFVFVAGICILSFFTNSSTASAGLYSGMELVFSSSRQNIYRCPVTDVLFFETIHPGGIAHSTGGTGLTYMPDPELPGLPLTQARYIELLNRQ